MRSSRVRPPIRSATSPLISRHAAESFRQACKILDFFAATGVSMGPRRKS